MMRIQMNLSNNQTTRQRRQMLFRGRNTKGSILNTNMLREFINAKPTGGCSSCGSAKKIGK